MALETLCSIPDSEQSVLHHLIGCFGIAQNVERVSKHPAPIVPAQFLECLLVAERNSVQ